MLVMQFQHRCGLEMSGIALTRRDEYLSCGKLESWSKELQAAAARLEALEKDTIVYEAVDIDDDDDASMDEDESKLEFPYIFFSRFVV